MEVYLVYHHINYESDRVLGVFSNYVKAREYELEYLKDNAMLEGSDWTEIRKVEVNKIYSYASLFDGIGEEV